MIRLARPLLVLAALAVAAPVAAADSLDSAPLATTPTVTRATVRSAVWAHIDVPRFTRAFADLDGLAAPERSVPDLVDTPFPVQVPGLLSARDLARHREIYALQAAGDWATADDVIATLDSELLLADIQAQRYRHPDHRTSYGELAAWLTAFPDHPDAPILWRLARSRQPEGATLPPRPVVRLLRGTGGGGGEFRHPADAAPPRRTDAQQRAVARLRARIKDLIADERPSQARRLLGEDGAARLLTATETGQLRADIAAGYFFFDRPEAARTLARAVAVRSGQTVPYAHWIAGLACWRLGAFDEAARHFMAFGGHPRVPPAAQAAGGYWAARSHLVAGQPARVNEWLLAAGRHPDTFYGRLARAALAVDSGLAWTVPAPGRQELAALAAWPGGARALALIQIGRSDRAERELRALHRRLDDSGRRTVAALAALADMPSLALRLAHLLPGVPPAARYPAPGWRPPAGFALDRALVYAIIRQESGFDADATSPAGAQGLMQLMPATARQMAGGEAADPGAPADNLRLGQRYLAHLLADPDIGGNLFLLLAAYNGGPGRLADWRRRQDFHDDPLLFLESIPARETRAYVERVLANLWAYRARLGQPAPSLEAIAAGAWPEYVALDPVTPATEDPVHAEH